jgi:hypothetical protein
LNLPPPKEETTMADKLVAFYPHRRNKDGSYDSICRTCFVTVAFGQSEAELMKLDAQHVCEFSTLSQRVFDQNVSAGRKPSAVAVLR